MAAMLTFGCMVCQKRMAVPFDMAGRPVRCPHCREISIAPTDGPSPIDQLEFSKPPEAADSILSEPDQTDDSVFAEGSGPRLPALDDPRPAQAPVSPQAGPVPAASSYPLPEPFSAHAPVPMPMPSYQAAPGAIGYGPPPMMPPPGYAPMPPQPMYYPPPQAPAPDAEGSLSTPVEAVTPRRTRPTPATLPIKEIIIVGLTIYGVVITIVAIMGWSRTPTPTRQIPDPPKKTTRGSTR